MLLEALGIDSCEEVAETLLQKHEQYSEFILLLLNADTLLPLQAQPEARGYFLRIRQHIQNKLATLPLPELKTLQLALVDTLMRTGTVQLGEGIRSLIAFLLLEREEEAPQLV